MMNPTMQGMGPQASAIGPIAPGADGSPTVGPPNPNELSPQMIQQMIALGSLSEEQAEALRQKMRGEEMVDSKMPGGHRTQAGFVADNPLSMLAAGLRSHKGAKKRDAADTRMGEIQRQQTDARGVMGEQIGQMMQSRQPSQPQQLPPGATPYGSNAAAQSGQPPASQAASVPQQPPQQPQQPQPTPQQIIELLRSKGIRL
jgi:hypothetical protein